MKRSAGMWMTGVLALVIGGAEVSARTIADHIPSELTITVAFGSTAARDRLRAFMETFRSGAGDWLADRALRQRLAPVVGASSLDGFEPAYALVVDLDGPQVALLGTVVDANALATGAGAAHVTSRGRWAVVGSAPVLDRIGPYALATLATQRAPTAPTATLYLHQLLAQRKADVDFHLPMLMRGVSLLPGGLSGPGLVLLTQAAAMIAEVDKLTLTLEVTPGLASIDLAITPLPGSRFATAIATLRPADFALLDRLPERAFLQLAGRRSPHAPGLGQSAPADATAGRDAALPLADLFTNLTGDFATSIAVAPRTGVSVLTVFRVGNTRVAEQAIRDKLARIEPGRAVSAVGLALTIPTSPTTTTHDGVVIRGIDLTTNLSQMPAIAQLPAPVRNAIDAVFQNTNLRMQLATFDGLATFALGTESLATTERTIDAMRGKLVRRVASALARPLVAAARARKDSVIVIFDIGAMLSAFMGGFPAVDWLLMMSVGHTARDAHLRIAVPALIKPAVPAPPP